MHPIPSVLFAVFVSSAFLCSCSLGKRQLVPANVAVDDAGSQHRQLHEIFNRYREAYYELNPMTARTKPGLHFDLMLIAEFNNTYADKLHALEAETLAHLLEIDPNALTDGDRLSLNVFSYDRKMRLEYYHLSKNGIVGFAKLDALMPLDPFDDLPFTFSLNASGVGGQSFATLAEYESWLRKLEKFDGWVAMAITHMRKGLKLGLVHPRSLVERSLEALKTHAIDFRRGVEVVQDAVLRIAVGGEVGKELGGDGAVVVVLVGEVGEEIFPDIVGPIDGLFGGCQKSEESFVL